jgi:hypothetical protein
MSEKTNFRKGNGKGYSAWWEERSRPQKVLVGIGFGILGIGLLALLGFVVMLLWNWVVPDIFGLKRLDYWHAWGLLALCWILFRGFRPGSSSGRSDRKRRQQLRRYIQEDPSRAGEDPAGSPEA